MSDAIAVPTAAAAPSRNPHEVSLGKHLRALARPVRAGYVRLNNGQIVRDDTRERWQRERDVRYPR